MLLGAERVAQGLPLYVRPNFHFIPYMYAPAYYYVSGWAVRLLGPSFLALRLISLLSTCGAFAIIYALVLVDTGGSRKRRHLAAFAGAALYASAFPWTRGWFDLGRLDSFYIFLLLLALLCTRLSESRLNPVIAAVAWTLTFLAKQTIFPVALIHALLQLEAAAPDAAGCRKFSPACGHQHGGAEFFYARLVPLLYLYRSARQCGPAGPSGCFLYLFAIDCTLWNCDADRGCCISSSSSHKRRG